MDRYALQFSVRQLLCRFSQSTALKGGETTLIINIGYDIEVAITTPMALIYLLRVHPSRAHDLLGPENVQMTPALPVDEYVDSFGNLCGRVNVPAGVPTVRFTNNAQVYDSGLPDEINWNARQHDPRDLPVE